MNRDGVVPVLPAGRGEVIASVPPVAKGLEASIEDPTKPSKPSKPEVPALPALAGAEYAPKAPAPPAANPKRVNAGKSWSPK